MNRKYIEALGARRQIYLDGIDKNDGDIDTDIFEDFYPDQAHFVFELLQNAEDAGATEVLFHLAREGCFIEHNGVSFTEMNVRSITGINHSTKSEALDKIGKYGVGFKSVFVYTCTPSVWSGDFSFEIIRHLKPVYIEPDLQLGIKTRFWLPFNNPAKKNMTEAYAEVDSGLRDLSETTLLFLTNIEAIRWTNANGESGDVKRVRHNGNHLEIHKKINGKTTASSHFLKFDQPVMGLANRQCVALAYPLDLLSDAQKFDAKKPLAKQLKIVPATKGQVAIYFPAKKENSGLRFHLHAPFVPELSRASIKETDANTPLFEQLATLAATSLHQVRNLGLLTPEFLSVLPNSHDSIGEHYDAIREAIVKAMNEEPLTPTYAKTHAPANSLFQAKSSLKSLLSKDDLMFLLSEDDLGFTPQWASARALQGSGIERFMSGLAITEWEENDFLKLLSQMASFSPRFFLQRYVTGPIDEFMNWLANKSTDWHQEFYALLLDYSSTLNIREKVRFFGELKLLQIVRLNNGDYSVGSKAYFPDDGAENDKVLPRVDIRIYTSGKKKSQKDSAKEFLKGLGVREVGEAEQIESILSQRYTAANISPAKNDLKRFVEFLEKNADKANLFSKYYIFENYENKWCMPSQIYLDAPFKKTGLNVYFRAMGVGARHHLLSDRYESGEVELKRLVKFAEAVGVHDELEILKTSCKENPEARILYSVGGRVTDHEINCDYVIEGLNEVLKAPSLLISKTIWQRMISLSPYYPDHLHAVYQSNASSGRRTSHSTFVHQLRAAQWIPQGENTFARPAEATRDLLPKGFVFDPDWHWLKSIGFGDEFGEKSEVNRQKKSTAEALGFRSVANAEKWGELEKRGVNPDELLAKFKKPDFLDRASPNSERRADKIADEVRNAAKKMRETKNRIVDPEYGDAQNNARNYLKSRYTDDDGIMFCQICKAPQPVKLNGVPHFEAITCVSGVNAHHEQNNLALCPNHAAMYKKSGLDSATIQAAIYTCKERVIPLDLAGNIVELVFSQMHLDDLRVVLGASL